MTQPTDLIAAWYSGKKVLITGGGGFISASIISLLRNVDCHVVRILRQFVPTSSYPGVARVEELIGDVRDPVLWNGIPDDVDVIFHLAAQTSTYEADRNPRTDLDSNVVPMLLLLQTCHARAFHPFIVGASTVTICGLTDRLPVNEDVPDVPVTAYDLHKKMSESYLGYYVRMGMGRGTMLRLANVYGPGPRSSRADRGILNQMVMRALRGESLTIYGTGNQLRDYVHVEDVALAFLSAAANQPRIDAPYYVIGRGQGHAIATAIRLVAERVGLRTGKVAPVVNVPPPAGLSPVESRNFIADTRRFLAATGWQPKVDLERGIDTIIESVQ